jgi:hypothetical protein
MAQLVQEAAAHGHTGAGPNRASHSVAPLAAMAVRLLGKCGEGTASTALGAEGRGRATAPRLHANGGLSPGRWRQRRRLLTEDVVMAVDGFSSVIRGAEERLDRRRTGRATPATMTQML